MRHSSGKGQTPIRRELCQRQTAQRLGLKVPLMGGDGWDAPDLFKIGGDALEGCYFSNHFAPDTATEKAKRFVADFTTKYGAPPSGCPVRTWSPERTSEIQKPPAVE